jgi:hypothetical protein
MDKQNKIKKSMEAKIKASQEKKSKPQQQPQQSQTTQPQSQTTQPPKKGCGCGKSERANVVRRIINIKRKS